MTFQSYKDESRKNWGSEQDKNLDTEQLTLGATLRIADAVEKMATRHTELIHERDYWENRARNAEQRLETERRRSASLRGHMKRMKRKQEV